MNHTPVVLVFAGPNGSGKSTVTKGFDIVGQYINADEIKFAEKCSDLEAAQMATALREEALNQKLDFTFETVLSTPRNVELLQRAKGLGYRVEVVFVLTANANINVARVANRVKNGGHDVPEDKIISRYTKSLTNLSKLISFVDILWVIDNSSDRASLIIYSKGGNLETHPTEDWTQEKIDKLIKG